MRIDRYGLVMLAALCAAAGCGDDDTVVEIPDAGQDAGADAGHGKHDAGGGGSGGATAEDDAGAENDGGAEEDGGVSSEPLRARPIVVHAKEYQFKPKRIIVGAGKSITIELHNDGVTIHAIEFDLPAGLKRLKPDVQPGAKGTLKLTTPTKKGSYDFFCPIDDHRALGMEGTLVVR